MVYSVGGFLFLVLYSVLFSAVCCGARWDGCFVILAGLLFWGAGRAAGLAKSKGENGEMPNNKRRKWETKARTTARQKIRRGINKMCSEKPRELVRESIRQDLYDPGLPSPGPWIGFVYQKKFRFV